MLMTGLRAIQPKSVVQKKRKVYIFARKRGYRNVFSDDVCSWPAIKHRWRLQAESCRVRNGAGYARSFRYDQALWVRRELRAGGVNQLIGAQLSDAGVYNYMVEMCTCHARRSRFIAITNVYSDGRRRRWDHVSDSVCL